MNASELIDKQIAELPDWRGKSMSKLRGLIHLVDPEVTEEWKWSTAAFAHKGMVCALGSFADHIKLNFFQGASLPDPHKLFNAGLEAKASRAIDFFESDEVDERALKELIQSAFTRNIGRRKGP